MDRNMKLPRRQFLHLAVGAAALPAASRIARAQTYPTRPIRWLVGLAPGGAADTMVRILSAWLSERLGQPVIVENKPGAATNLSIQTVANSPPDGYTLVLTGSSTAINSSLYRKLPFNPLRDMAPVAGLVTWPKVLEANPSVPAKTVSELIAHAKAHPGQINMASWGTGTPSHIAGELFKMMAGIDIVHVPYRGGGPAMLVDLLAGQVQIAFDTLGLTLPHIRSGALRALAMAGRDRFEGLPDIPTVADAVPGFEATVWGAVAVPRATSHEIIERLNREINAGLANPVIKTKLAELTATPLIFTPDELSAYFAAEVEKWGKVVNFIGTKLD
jgi:tripartite-type tricarboxylate transporter receptor subunit TctC